MKQIPKTLKIAPDMLYYKNKAYFDFSVEKY